MAKPKRGESSQKGVAAQPPRSSSEATGEGVRTPLEAALSQRGSQAQWVQNASVTSTPVVREEPAGDVSLELLRRTAEAGSAEAQAQLGLIYSRGTSSVAADPEAARAWLERAAEAGHPKALTNLGTDCMLRGEYSRAIELLERAAESSAKAQHNLGVIYELCPDESFRDLAKARERYERAAAQGMADAQTQLGQLSFSGRGIPKDLEKARLYFELAAAQDHPRAQLFLGSQYYDGTGGLEKDCERGVALMERSAELDDPLAQSVVGDLLLSGDHPHGADRERALALLERAAAAGNSQAEFKLGFAYGAGTGNADNDFEKARHYLERAASKDEPEALHCLGLMEKNDVDREGSDVAAFEYFERAAALGHRVAMQECALWCANGRATPKDFERAWSYLSAAADAGLDSAQEIVGVGHEALQGLADAALEHAELFAEAFRKELAYGTPNSVDQDMDSEPEPATESDLTARGTPRVRPRFRSREEVGGDPRSEKHRRDVRPGGRIPRELRDEFVRIVEAEGVTQSAALTEAVEDYVEKKKPELDQ